MPNPNESKTANEIEAFHHITDTGLKLLIINNYRSQVGAVNLRNALHGKSTKIVDYETFDTSDILDVDAIILSGGNTYPVVANLIRLKKQIELIRNTDKPILGICYGFQVIAEAYGGKIEKMPKQRKEVVEISKVNDDPIFDGISNLRVWENHKYAVIHTGSDLKILATSTDGIEILKHVSKPVYGFQFHPEHTINNAQAKLFLENFLKLVLRK